MPTPYEIFAQAAAQKEPEPVTSLLDPIKQGFGQQLAGVYETLAGSPKAEGIERLVPSGLLGVYSLLGLINENVPYAKRAGELFKATEETANKTFGVENPKDYIDTMNRIGLTALLPTPKIKEAATVGQAVKNIGMELLAPGLQSRTKSGMALATAVPTALVEGISQATDRPDYTTVFEAFGGTPEQPVATKPLEFTSTYDIFAKAAEENYKEESNAISLAIGGTLGLLAGVAGIKALKHLDTFTDVPPSDFLGIKDVSGKDTTIITDFKAGVFAKDQPLIDLIEENYKGHDAFINNFRNLVQTSYSPQAQAKKIEEGLRTGNLPFSVTKLNNPQGTLDGLAELPPETFSEVGEALILGSKIDDMIEFGINEWKHANGVDSISLTEMMNKFGTMIAKPEVNQQIVNIRNMLDPMPDYLHEVGIISSNTLAEYKKGRPNYVPLRINFSDENNSKLGEMARSLKLIETPVSGDEALNFLVHRDVVDGVAYGELANPLNLVTTYIEASIRAAETNRIRRIFFESMDNVGMQFKGVEKVSEAGPRVVTVHEFNGEKSYYRFTKENESLYRALENTPNIAIPLINAMRKTFTNFNTGYGSPEFMPTSILYEMTTLALLKEKGLKTGMVDELMTKLGYDKTLSDIIPVDPTMIFAPITGTMKGIGADLAWTTHRYMDKLVRQQSGLVKLLGGEANVKKFSKTMSDAYLSSTKHMANRYSGTNAMYAEAKSGEEVHTMLHKVSPEFYRRLEKGGISRLKANTLWRAYSSIVENMHNSIRIQAAASTIPNDIRKMLKDPALYQRNADLVDYKMNEIMGKVRRGGIDLSKQGGNQVVTLFNQAVPYSNVSIQVAKGYYDGLKKNPVQFFGGLTSVIGTGAFLLINQFEDNPEAANFFYNEMQSSQRNIIPIFDNEGKLIIDAKIEPALELPWRMMVEAIGTLLGYKAGTEKVNFDSRLEMLGEEASERLGDIALESIAKSGVNPIDSPTLGATLAALGTDPNQFRISEGRFSIGKPYTERLTGEDSAGRTTESMPIIVEQVLEEVLGITGTMINNMAITYNGMSNGDFKESEKIMKALGQGYLTKAERLPVVSPPMFDVEFKLSTKTFEKDYNQKARTNLKALHDTFVRDTFKGTGTTAKSYGFQHYQPETLMVINPTTGEKVPSKLVPIINAAAQLEDWINKTADTRLSSLYNLRSELPSNIEFASSPEKMRIERNRITNEINKVQKDIHTMLIRHEDNLSKILGEPIRFDKLDIEKLKSEPFLR